MHLLFSCEGRGGGGNDNNGNNENNLSYTDGRRTNLRANVVNPQYPQPNRHPPTTLFHTWVEPRHSVATCAHTTGHGCARTNPAQPSDKYQKGMKPKIRRPFNCLKLSHSAITSHFSDSLGSFQPNRHLVAVGHGCARTTETKVKDVPDCGHLCVRATNTRIHDTASAMSVYMLHNWQMNVS